MYCFILLTSLEVSTFAINYRGHPFMESLVENRPLLYSLAGAGGFVVMLALGMDHKIISCFIFSYFTGWLPEFSSQMSIVDFSDEFRSVLVQVSGIDKEWWVPLVSWNRGGRGI